MKIFILILLTTLLTACAVVPLAPPPFYDGPYDGPRIDPHRHFAPVPVPVPPPPSFGHGFPGRHHR
jgi:hypothetical protein